MKEITEQIGNATFIGAEHIQIHEAWMATLEGYRSSAVQMPHNISDCGYLEYGASLKLAKLFITNLKDPYFDMARVKVYDWSNGDDKLTVFVTVDDYIYDKNMNLPRIADRKALEALFIYHAGKKAIATTICHYLENGGRDKNPNYFCVKPWGDSTKHGEPYRVVKNNVYSAEEFLDKVD